MSPDQIGAWAALVTAVLGGIASLVAVLLRGHKEEKEEAAGEKPRVTPTEAAQAHVRAEAVRLGVTVDSDTAVTLMEAVRRQLLAQMEEQAQKHVAAMQAMEARHAAAMAELRAELGHQLQQQEHAHAHQLGVVTRAYQRLRAYVVQLRDQITQEGGSPADWPDDLPTVLEPPLGGTAPMPFGAPQQ